VIKEAWVLIAEGAFEEEIFILALAGNFRNVGVR